MRKHLVAAVLLSLFSPALASAYQERLIISMEAGSCSLRVEADDQSHTFRLRVYPERPDCGMTREAVQEILNAASAGVKASQSAGTHSSLFIGRLIGYPWLSQHLAKTAYSDQGWNRAKGKPVSMDLYRYVASILSTPEVTSPIQEALRESGYRIAAVTIEKVLVGSFRDVPGYRGEELPGKVPYDCMVWFRLERR